jgi:hypothetical protein
MPITAPTVGPTEVGRLTPADPAAVAVPNAGTGSQPFADRGDESAGE